MHRSSKAPIVTMLRTNKLILRRRRSLRKTIFGGISVQEEYFAYF